MTRVLVLLLFSLPALAQSYVDLGLSISDNADDSVFIQNPVGHVEAGYEFGSAAMFVRHNSGLTDGSDRGFNQVGARLRLRPENLFR